MLNNTLNNVNKYKWKYNGMGYKKNNNKIYYIYFGFSKSLRLFFWSHFIGTTCIYFLYIPKF